MNLRLGKVKVPRRFIVVGNEVFELDKDGEFFYHPEYNKVSNGYEGDDSCEEDYNDMNFPWSAGEYLQVNHIGKLTRYQNFSTLVAPAKKDDYVLIAGGGKPRIAEVQSVDGKDWSIECYKTTGRIKYGHYSLIVEAEEESEEMKALKYLYKSGEDVATSLTYKIHEELRSDTPDYNKVNEMVRLVEYYRGLYD